MEQIRINENTWRFEEEGVRFFLLAGTEKALLIDSGMMTTNAREIAEDVLKWYAAELAGGSAAGVEPGDVPALPLELLNTHADLDHMAGNAAFGKFYMHPDECYNYYKNERPDFLPAPPADAEIVPVWDGDVLDLGGRELEIIGLPGHTPGSIAVLDRAARVLISGDPIQDGNIFMFGPMREMHAYRMSLQRLEKIMEERDPFDEIWASHGSFPVKPELVRQLDEAAGRVLAGEVGTEPIDMHGMTVQRADVGCAAFLLD